MDNTIFYDGVHEDCSYDYRHNHSTIPLRQVLSEEELDLIKLILEYDEETLIPIEKECGS